MTTPTDPPLDPPAAPVDTHAERLEQIHRGQQLALERSDTNLGLFEGMTVDVYWITLELAKLARKRVSQDDPSLCKLVLQYAHEASSNTRWLREIEP